MNIKKLVISVKYEEQDGNVVDAGNLVEWEAHGAEDIHFSFEFQRPVKLVHGVGIDAPIIQTESAGFEGFTLTANRQGPSKVLWVAAQDLNPDNLTAEANLKP